MPFSFTATATIFLPILAELGVTVGVNPLFLMIPATIASSFAFMLPVATPPNAIVFAYGHLKISDMMKAGAIMNIVCIALLVLAINTYGFLQFNLGELPPWAMNGIKANATTGPILAEVNASLSDFIVNSTGYSLQN